MAKGCNGQKGTRFDGENEKPIERTNARKRGGSFSLTLRAESARAIGLEPTEVDSDERFEFVVSETEVEDGRLIFDLLGRSDGE